MEPIELTLEQQFQLRILKDHTQGLSQKQAQDLLLLAVRQGMIKDNIIRRCKLVVALPEEVAIPQQEKITIEFKPR
ncbi:MAG: NblA/ycf18 family protein [Chroococcidiopsidaceae cyanobacterium CP_BM_ER_R8_30]|nr:NblA/ycf18 family protein [Chroococcidiopsidaceae cyanobacterium CP_BM_ER_R8_30]